MLRFGSTTPDGKDMDEGAIFLAKLQLLIIMAKAYIKGFPLGKYRREAIIKNSEEVFYTSLHMTRDAAVEPRQETTPNANESKEMNTSHLFHQRVHLLCVMTRAIAEDRLEGDFKIKALEDNLAYLCEAITFNGQDSDIQFLKVA